MSINVGFSVEVNEKMNVKMSDRALSNCWLSLQCSFIYLAASGQAQHAGSFAGAHGLSCCGAQAQEPRGLSCSEAGACGILVPQPGIRPMSRSCKVNS